MARYADTRIVEPLDYQEAVTWWSATIHSTQPRKYELRVEPSESEVEASSDDDIDWDYEDADLSQSLKAIKSGRGPTIALLLAAVGALAAALLVLA